MPLLPQDINDTISRAKEEVKILINKFQSDQLEAQPGCSMMESFENQVNQVCYRFPRAISLNYVRPLADPEPGLLSWTAEKPLPRPCFLDSLASVSVSLTPLCFPGTEQGQR